MGRIIVLIFLVIVMLTKPVSAAELDSWQPYIAEAAGRFGIPEIWIRAVIKTESGGESNAVSVQGAMGLMQLMPDTWTDMQNTLGLGRDPFDPHDNILAGTAYLRAMLDRFGYPALFAAYNAGPARYEDFLSTGKPLPEETKTYAAEVEKTLTGVPRLSSDVPRRTIQIASRAGIFFQLTTTRNRARNTEKSVPPGDLFVRLSTEQAVGK